MSYELLASAFITHIMDEMETTSVLGIDDDIVTDTLNALSSYAMAELEKRKNETMPFVTIHMDDPQLIELMTGSAPCIGGNGVYCIPRDCLRDLPDELLEDGIRASDLEAVGWWR